MMTESVPDHLAAARQAQSGLGAWEPPDAPSRTVASTMASGGKRTLIPLPDVRLLRMLGLLQADPSGLRGREPRFTAVPTRWGRETWLASVQGHRGAGSQGSEGPSRAPAPPAHLAVPCLAGVPGRAGI